MRERLWAKNVDATLGTRLHAHVRVLESSRLCNARAHAGEVDITPASPIEPAAAVRLASTCVQTYVQACVWTLVRSQLATRSRGLESHAESHAAHTTITGSPHHYYRQPTPLLQVRVLWAHLVDADPGEFLLLFSLLGARRRRGPRGAWDGPEGVASEKNGKKCIGSIGPYSSRWGLAFGTGKVPFARRRAPRREKKY